MDGQLKANPILFLFSVYPNKEKEAAKAKVSVETAMQLEHGQRSLCKAMSLKVNRKLIKRDTATDSQNRMPKTSLFFRFLFVSIVCEKRG